MADELRSHHLPRRSAAHPSVHALQSGGTQWVRTVDDAFLQSVAVDEAHLEVMRALDLTAVVAVPLTAAALGTIALGEQLSAGAAVGAAMVLGGLAALAVKPRARRPATVCRAMVQDPAG